MPLDTYINPSTESVAVAHSALGVIPARPDVGHHGCTFATFREPRAFKTVGYYLPCCLSDMQY